MQKTYQTNFRVEEVSRRKEDELSVKWKDYDNSLNNWIDKKYIVIENELFSRSIYPQQKQNKVELDLSSYAAKFDLKNATSVDTSDFAKKADLASLK